MSRPSVLSGSEVTAQRSRGGTSAISLPLFSFVNQLVCLTAECSALAICN